MAIFGHLLRSSRGPFLLALLAGVVSGGTGAAFIAVVNAALARDGAFSATLVWLYAGLCLATVLTKFAAQSLLFRLSQEVIYDLRRRLVDAVLGAPLRSVERTGTPKLYSALSDDVMTIANALPGLPALCTSVAFVVVALVYLTVLSPLVAGATLVTAIAGVLVYRLFSGRGTRALAAARNHQDALFAHFRAVTEGVKELKLNRARREAIAGRELDETARAYRRRSVLGLIVFEGAAGSGQAVFFVFIGALLFAFPAAAGITTETLAASVLVLLFTVSSLQGVLVWLPILGRASVALTKIEERLRELEPERPELAVREPAGTPGATRFADWRRIEFRGVSHVYPGPKGEQFVLGPLDFAFHRGELLFVVGANGSGKTTLAKVLTSLYTPESGGIWVDDRPVTDQDRDDYRQLFSVVFSDFFLFDSLLGLPEEDRVARAERYLARLQLDHKVSIADGRFSTTALSQGQRKRLALLAAYLEDRSCYVFDEWAADQDPVFKEFFYQELLAELKAGGKTVVVISHDDRYFHVADRLVRLDHGQLRELDQDQPRRRGDGSGGQTVAARTGVETVG